VRLKIATLVLGVLLLTPSTQAADPEIVADTASATFTPSEVTVGVGATVTVSRASGGIYEHNSHYYDQPSGCPSLPTTESWTCQRTFDTPGDYKFHCDLHTAMTATVHVVAASNSPPAASAPTTPAGTPTPPPATTSKPRTVRLGELARIPKGCVSRRYRIQLRRPARLSTASVFVNGRRVATVKGKALSRRIRLHAAKRRFTLKVETTLTDGSRLVAKRKLRRCG
jgi:plastocyanin